MRAQKTSLGGKNPILNPKDKKKDFSPETHESVKSEPAGKPQQAESAETVHRSQPKVGRNDPCPCGSGKKYKKCCLAA